MSHTWKVYRLCSAEEGILHNLVARIGWVLIPNVPLERHVDSRNRIRYDFVARTSWVLILNVPSNRQLDSWNSRWGPRARIRYNFVARIYWVLVLESGVHWRLIREARAFSPLIWVIKPPGHRGSGVSMLNV